MFGRILTCSVARDNGRATEFIRRKNYPDKSRCFECGEEGHLSYACPSNTLGERQRPPKKKKKKDGNEESEDEETLDAAIRYQREKAEEEEYRLKVLSGDYSIQDAIESTKQKTIAKSVYFSDEEDNDI